MPGVREAAKEGVVITNEPAVAISVPEMRAYIIVRGMSLYDLEFGVNEKIGRGYVPLGGVSYCPKDYSSASPESYFQAMVYDRWMGKR